MILVTGGAGFIGSNLVRALNEQGRTDIVVCDRLRNQGKWKNLVDCQIAEIVYPSNIDMVLKQKKIKNVIHLGAVSNTEATDGDLVAHTNFSFSLELFNWCADNEVSFIYASSAATYGDRVQNFLDGYSEIHQLQPQNLYAWSKHQFDLQAAAIRIKPPQVVGLKFFNVYGPRELHKGKMASLVTQRYPDVINDLSPRLFSAGHQKRDFIYVDDVVLVILWFMRHPHYWGLFNVGTGQARSFYDLITILMKACGKELPIDLIDMPPHLEKQYQSFTQADISSLRKAGYDKPFMPIEEGVPKTVEWLKVHS